MAGDQLEIEDFDTAKAVFEKLKDMPAERRKRILNWVAEDLNPPGSSPCSYRADFHSDSGGSIGSACSASAGARSNGHKNVRRHEGTEE
jgi:thymidylate synthase